MRRLGLALLAGLSASLATGAALACSCEYYPADHLWRQSSLVVIGEVSAAKPVRVSGPDGRGDEADLILVARREKGRDGARRLKVVSDRGGDALDCNCSPIMPDPGKRHRFYLRPAEGLPGVYELWAVRRPQ